MMMGFNRSPLGSMGLVRTSLRGLGVSSGPQYPANPNTPWLTNLPAVTADGFTIPRVSDNIHFPGDAMNVYRGFPMPGAPIDPTLAPVIAQYGGRASDGTNSIMPVRDDSQSSHVSVVPPPAGTQDYTPGSKAWTQVQDTISAIKAQIAGDAALYSPAYQNIPCPGALFQQWTVSQGGYQQNDGTQGYYPGTPDDQQSAAGGCSWGWYSLQDPGYLRTGVPNDIRFQAQSPGSGWVQIAKGTPIVKMAGVNAYQYQLGGGGSQAQQPTNPAPTPQQPPVPALPAPVQPTQAVQPTPPPTPAFTPGDTVYTSYPEVLPPVSAPSSGSLVNTMLQPPAIFTSAPELPIGYSSAVPATQSIPSMMAQQQQSVAAGSSSSAAPASTGSITDQLTNFVSQNPLMTGAIVLGALFLFGSRK